MWDVKVRDATVIKGVLVWSTFECLFILEDAILEFLILLCKLAILDCGVGFAVGDGGEQSIGNGVKELSIDVRVHGKGGLGGLWGHCWWCWSCWTRDWEWCQRLGG